MKHMKTSYVKDPNAFSLLWVFVILIFPQSLFTQELNIVGNTSFMPYVYPDNSGQATGISILYLKKILDQANIKSRIELVPVKRLLLDVYISDFVGCAVFRTKEREQQYSWIIPITPHIKSVLLKLKTRSDIQLREITDARKYRVGIISGNNIQTSLIELGFSDGVNLMEVTTNRQNIEKLFLNRLDLIAIRESAINTEIVELGYSVDQLEIAATIQDDGSAWVIGNKNLSIDVVRKIQDAYEKVSREISVEEFASEYIKQTFKHPPK